MKKQKQQWFQFSQQEIEDIIKKQLKIEGLKVSDIEFVDDDHFVDIGRLGAKIKYKYQEK